MTAETPPETPLPPRRRIRTPWRRRVSWFFHGAGPVAAWIIAVAVCIQLTLQDASTYRSQGIVDTHGVRVSAPFDGALQELLPAVLDPVAAGDVVGLLDSSVAKAEVALLRAEGAALRTEIELRRHRLAVDMAQREEDRRMNVRRLELDISGTALDVIDRRVDLETTRLELARLELERNRVARLADIGFEDEQTLEEIDIQVERARAVITETLAGLEQARADVDAARGRLAEYTGSLEPMEADPETEALRHRAEVLAAEAAVAEARLAQHVLRAPITGIVIARYAEPGETAIAGEPVIEIASPLSETVTLLLAENERRRPKPGERVVLVAASGERAHGTVTAVGDTLVPKPIRLWARPNAEEQGRPVVVRLEESGSLAPGLRVEGIFGR